jgi:hypothetical protein
MTSGDGDQHFDAVSTTDARDDLNVLEAQALPFGDRTADGANRIKLQAHVRPPALSTVI